MSENARAAEIPLDRDEFMRTLLRELSGTLQRVVGLEEASGFVSVVGQLIGERINALYAEHLATPFDRDRVAEVLVDLKRRIEGDFYIESVSPTKLVLGNRRCPFGDKVIDRPALCMMTSNVFGVITAEHLGYAKVEIAEAIARGDRGCRVVVHLEETDEARAADGRVYIGG